jgi:L-amino acid N-acyltransferase YncA
MTTIRLAAESDAEAVQAIYAPNVQHTPISFEYEIPTVEEMRARIHKTLITHPWLICQNGQGEIMGYVYASKHRERTAYQWSVDVTAYVSSRAQRSGIARGLYTSLFALLRLQGFYNAYAGIAMPNDASIGAHTAVGFQPIGVYHNVGYKFGKWHDVSWWGLELQPPNEAADPTPPKPLHEVMNHPEWQAALNAGLPLIRL